MTVIDDVLGVLGKAQKGMLSREVAAALKHKDASYASKYLDRAVSQGLVLKMPEGRHSSEGGGRVMRYFVPEFAVGAMAENARQTAELKRLARLSAKESQRRRRSRAQGERRERESDGELPFTHRVIPAGQAKPMRVVQPRWVFDLAQSS